MATILIVDDCPENRKHFVTPLHHQGHRLLEAADGANALELARSERPHLIIADAQVPRMDGYEIVRHLRSDREMAQTRIILYSDRDFQHEAIALAHAVDVPVVLPKPSQPEEVVRMVDLALRQIKGAAVRRRRIDRQHSPRPLTSAPHDVAELARVTAENERLKAELSGRTEELNRDVAKRTQTDVHKPNSLGLRATNDIRLQALFDKALDAIVLTDDEKRFVDANPAACRMLGYSREELLQMTVFEITPSQNNGAVENLWQRFLATGKQRGEYTVLCKDGTTREVEYQAAASALPGLQLSLMRDITERKRAERRLQESEEQFRQLAEHIGEVFWMNDPVHSQLIYVSPAYEKIWGRTRESLYISPQSWTEAIHPDDRDRVVAAAGTMHTRSTYDQTYRILRPDGSIRWIRDRAFPVHDRDGKLIRMAGIAEDITESKTLQDERDGLLARLRIQIDRLPLAYILIDANGRVVDWNPAAEKTFGYTKEEALGRVCVDLIVPSPVSDHLREIIRRIWAGDMNAHSVNENQMKDGRIITCQWFNTPLIEADGRFVGVISLAQDITDRKRAEEALFESAQRSQILSRAWLKFKRTNAAESLASSTTKSARLWRSPRSVWRPLSKRATISRRRRTTQ